tara:strand:- start:1448 stop:1699 length:252 start_codon:yes stop_codon:yes gene_type:complete
VTIHYPEAIGLELLIHKPRKAILWHLGKMLFIVLIPCTSAVIILDRSSENVVYFPYLRHQDTLAIWGIGGLKYPSTIRLLLHT